MEFTYAQSHARTRSITNSTRNCTQTQINARKLTTAIDTWAISACKCDCVLCVRSKTFRMYYMYVHTNVFMLCFSATQSVCFCRYLSHRLFLLFLYSSFFLLSLLFLLPLPLSLSLFLPLPVSPSPSPPPPLSLPFPFFIFLFLPLPLSPSLSYLQWAPRDVASFQSQPRPIHVIRQEALQTQLQHSSPFPPPPLSIHHTPLHKGAVYRIEELYHTVLYTFSTYIRTYMYVYIYIFILFCSSQKSIKK